MSSSRSFLFVRKYSWSAGKLVKNFARFLGPSQIYAGQQRDALQLRGGLRSFSPASSPNPDSERQKVTVLTPTMWTGDMTQVFVRSGLAPGLSAAAGDMFYVHVVGSCAEVQCLGSIAVISLRSRFALKGNLRRISRC